MPGPSRPRARRSPGTSGPRRTECAAENASSGPRSRARSACCPAVRCRTGRSPAGSGAPARANSSASTTWSMTDRPAPPYSFGQDTAISPWAARVRRHSLRERASRRRAAAPRPRTSPPGGVLPETRGCGSGTLPLRRGYSTSTSRQGRRLVAGRISGAMRQSSSPYSTVPYESAPPVTSPQCA